MKFDRAGFKIELDFSKPWVLLALALVIAAAVSGAMLMLFFALDGMRMHGII